MNEHPKSPDFTIDLNVNVRFPGLTAFFPLFNRLEGTLMALTDAITNLEASNAALTAKIEESNGKQDALILVASQTKDALVAALAAAGGADPALEARVQKIIDDQTAAVSSITTQEGETDAATAADAP